MTSLADVLHKRHYQLDSPSVMSGRAAEHAKGKPTYPTGDAGLGRG